MARGLLMGTVSGLAFAAMVLAVASLLAPQPAGNRPPEAPATELAPSPDSPQGGDVAPGAAVAADAAGAGAAPPAVPQASAEGGLPVADTASAAVPEISRTDALAAAPETGSVPEPVAGPDAPVVPSVQGQAPQLPAADTLALSTAPAARPAPLEPALEPPAESPAPDALPVADAPPAEGVAPPQDSPPAVSPGDAPAEADTATAGLPEITEAGNLPQVVPPDADSGAPDPAAESAPAPASPPPAGSEAAVPDALPAAAEPATAAADGLPGGETGVRVNRPGIDTPSPEPLPAVDAGPALARYAAAFTDPGGLPYLSIVVIDDGSLQPGPEILASVPFPVTVAIDPTRTDAAAAMAAYRAAGIEVAALANLPEGTGPTDVNVNLQATFATLSETVALVDAQAGGLAADPDLAAAALARLSESGRGFVWMASEGLDQVSDLATGAGVPAAPLLRDLDGAGQDAATIRRFIDNAAFQARRDGEVVLLARLRPETVSALTLWGTANRARQVTMAPLSALLAHQP